MINPIILLCTIFIYGIVFLGTILKKPNFPILSGASLVISIFYIFILYTINEKILSSTSLLFSKDVTNFILKISVLAVDLKSLESAFSMFSIVIVILFAITVISMILDVKRIFFEKTEI